MADLKFEETKPLHDDPAGKKSAITDNAHDQAVVVNAFVPRLVRLKRVDVKIPYKVDVYFHACDEKEDLPMAVEKLLKKTNGTLALKDRLHALFICIGQLARVINACLFKVKPSFSRKQAVKP